MDSKKNDKISLVDKLKYWLDNYIQKGFVNLLILLFGITLVFVFIFAIIIILFGFKDETFNNVREVIFYSASTIINRWMPEANREPGFYFVMSAAAIAGLFITGAIISVITNALDERIDKLKHSDSVVMEEGHIIILGFIDKNYVLIEQLIKANVGKNLSIVIADNCSCEEMSKKIYQNVKVPKNIKIIFRTFDIYNSKDYEKLHMKDAKKVIVNLNTNINIVKIFLAIISYEEKFGVTMPVFAIMENDQMKLTNVFNDNKNFIILFIKKLIVKLISQGFVDYSITRVYAQLFTFDGVDLHVEDAKECVGMTFENIMDNVVKAIPIGIYRDGEVLLNPSKEVVFNEQDKLILCEEKLGEYLVVNTNDNILDIGTFSYKFAKYKKGICTIFGYNDILANIIEEIASKAEQMIVVLDEKTMTNANNRNNINSLRKKYDNIEFSFIDYWEESELKEVAESSNHIVVLNSHDPENEEEEEIVNMMKVFKLRKLREKYNMNFNMIVELMSKDNKAINMDDKNIDFIIANEIPSTLLAQISETPELYNVFVELLSDKGSNVMIKSFENIENVEMTVVDLRRYLYRKGYIFLGVIDNNKKIKWMVNLQDKIILTKDIALILIGKEIE